MQIEESKDSNMGEIPIYVINVWWASERLRRFDANHGGFHLPYSRWEGIDKNSFPTDAKGWVRVRAGETIVDGIGAIPGRYKPGKLANFANHLSILREVVESRYSAAIIMEDDGQLERQVPLRLEEWELPDDTDIVFLNDRVSADNQNTVKKTREGTLHPITGGCGTDGYLVTRQGAEKLVEILDPVGSGNCCTDLVILAHTRSLEDRQHSLYPKWCNQRKKDVRLNAYKISPSFVRNDRGRSILEAGVTTQGAERNRPWRRRSSFEAAAIILPFLKRTLQLRTKSVVDIGCGAGEWLCVSRMLGATDLVGIGQEPDPNGALASEKSIELVKFDLNNPINLQRKFDLAICLETVEHVEKSRSKALVSEVASLADTLVFSAAIPGQGGVGHVNEQPQNFWVELFQTEGMDCYDILRPRFLTDKRLVWWYRQNLLLFTRSKEIRNRARRLMVDGPVLEIDLKRSSSR